MPTFSAPENVSLDVAQHVLWHFGDYGLGLEPGNFTGLLLRAIAAADAVNRERLREVFPEHVRLVALVAGEHAGLEWLREIVRARATTEVSK